MSLSDQDSGLMDGFSLEAFVEDSGLKSSVEELVYGETQDVIEL